MIDSSKPVVVGAFAQSDVGLIRENNEDSFLVADLTDGVMTPDTAAFNHMVGKNGSLFLVADGMGGAEAGEVASRMAVELVTQKILDELRSATSIDDESFVRILKRSIEDANVAIFQESHNNKSHQGMGTTLTAAAVCDATIFFAQLGDSRAYLVRNGSITQMTEDQSLVAQLVVSGALRPEEAKGHPQRHVILQALGIQSEVNVAISFAALKRGDRAVLCSDGLSGKVEIEEVNEVLQRWANPKDACRRLVELARERGGEDNITVIVAGFDGEGLPLPDPQEVPVYNRVKGETRRRFWPWGWR